MIDLLFSDPARFVQQLILLIPAFLIAITVHELAHGLVADRLGDPTARLQGRLTLNPLPHIDPLGAIAFLLAGFGWAKPVPVNSYNLRHPVRDMAWIAAAGPISNFLVAFLGLSALVMAHRSIDVALLAQPLQGIFYAVFRFNLVLAIFNLIPLPPLDGGHFLPYFLPRGSWTLIHQLEQYGPMILLLLVMSGATRYVLGPVSAVVEALYVGLARLIFNF
jgi:Zn-dependent protease